MNFSIIRLGKSSVKEILLIDSLEGVLLPVENIVINCKQVPIEVGKGTFCFLWLGSDNNKGLPTTWEQGLKAIGRIKDKTGGPLYNDEWTLAIEIPFVFRRAIKQLDILQHAPYEYLNFSQIPILGLNTHSNQTVQLIKEEASRQNIQSLFTALMLIDKSMYRNLEEAFPELLPVLTDSKNAFNDDRSAEVQSFSERETIGSSGTIPPFDPTKIDIRPQPLTIISILKRLSSNPTRIDLNTEFQRKGNLWEEEKQSRLIESLLVRIPLPAFYFDGTSDKWLIVDGLQRVGALKNFIVDKSFTLKGLEYLKNLEGLRWDDLPTYLQTRVEETAITAYIINPGTPEEVKFNIFKRINTGGLVLTPQEIRHALNQGIPANFIKKLAEEPSFIKAMGGSVPTDRMEDRDYVTRFVGFYLDRENYQPDLDTFLNKGMSKLNGLKEFERSNLLTCFVRSQEAAYEIFGEYAFRKRQKINDRKKPVNKALFECVSVLLAKLNSYDLSILLREKNAVEMGLIKLLNSNVNFFRSITSGTGDSKAVERRYTAIDNLFKKIINDRQN